MDKRPFVLAIVGPTASGKTALAVRLAAELDGEIVSCDSMQIYRGMDIGTAKPTEEEKQGVPHHMIDVADVREPFSSADYAAKASRCIEDITARGKLPVICGGTGLYLDALLRGDDNSGGGADLEYRAKMEALALEKGKGYVHGLLAEIDPESAASIHPNNIKRVIRALEIRHVTGTNKSELDRLSREKVKRYDSLVLGLRYNDRQTLYDRIDRRVDDMIERGLCDEVRALYDEGVFFESRTASQAIGYKELLGYIRGELALDVCVDELKRATRRYAKRQMTWFRALEDINWIDVDGESAGIGDEKIKTFEDIVNIAKKLLADFKGCGIM